MEELFKRISSVRHVLLPGPIDVGEDVLARASIKPVSYKSREFTELFIETHSMLREILGLYSGEVVILTGSGALGLDAVLASILCGWNARVLIPVYGYFGIFVKEIVSRYTDNIETINYGYHNPPDRDMLLKDISERDFDILILIHNETSTGYTYRFLRDLARVVREKNAYLIVDGVSSVGVEEIRMDEWGVDVVVTASQKALGAIPGLAIVGLSERAIELIKKVRERRKPPFYMDLWLYIEYLRKHKCSITTPGINTFYTLYTSLKKIIDYGVKNYYRLHRDRALSVYKRVDEHRLETIVKNNEYRSHSVVVLETPGKALDIVEKVYRDLGIAIAPGLGDIANDIVRIGIMGFIDTDIVVKVVDYIARLLRETT